MITIKKGRFERSAEPAGHTKKTTAAKKSDRLEQDYRKMTQKPVKKKKNNEGGKKKVLIALIAVTLALIVGVGVFLWIYSRDDGLIFDNVYALDVNLAGMTQEEAADTIRQRAQELYAQDLTVELQDRTLVLMAADTGVSVDAEAIAQAAFDYGRDGNMFDRAKARSAAALTSYTLDVTEYLELDTYFIEEAVNQLGAEIYTELTQSTINVTGNQPDLTKYVMPDSIPEGEEVPDGITVVDTENPNYVEGGQSLSIQVGTPGRSLDTESLLKQIIAAYESGDLSVISTTYDVVEPNPVSVQDIYAQYCVAPVDSVLDTDTYIASQEVLGYGFDAQALQVMLDEAEEGETIDMEFQILIPEVTKASIEKDLFQDVLISLSTKHVRNAKRTTNLDLASKAINGFILKPGATFSFNEVVGERTKAKGYQEAAVYAGNDTVDQLGGGICQVASTMYYGALQCDFEIVERTAHRFSVDYVPKGCDATIYWDSKLDFKFKNNTGYPIKIIVYVADGRVHLEYLGTETKDYTVELKWSQESKEDWETVELVYDEKTAKEYPDNKVGDVVVTPYTGYTGKTYMYKYDKETGELIEKLLVDSSKYVKRDKVVLVAEKTAPTEPKPTEPEPTEPKPTEPKPTEPEPTEPAPTEPAPTEPAPSEGGDE